MVPAGLVSGEGLCPYYGTFSLCFHMAEVARDLSGASFTRAVIPFMRTT